MGNFSKWLWGIIIIIATAILFGWFAPAPLGAKANSIQMGQTVQTALNDGGFGWAKVDMSGNVARLEGEAPSEAAKIAAIATAKDAECGKCADRRWHEVDASELTVEKVIPTQIPYTLGAILADDGSVVLRGYVRNEEDFSRLRTDAVALFGDKLSGFNLKIAKGAPELDWHAIAKTHLSALNMLKSGEFTMSDMDSFLSGEAESEDVRESINALFSGLPAGFNGSSKINVEGAAPVVIGQLKSENVCQDLFNELKGDNKINFGYDKANIDGEASQILLDNIARAAKQCSSFQITVGGHTDSNGPAVYNLNLSQLRANAVETYLIAQGVDSDNITAIGYGEAQPIASNGTPQGAAKNRRIEFKVTRSR